MPWLLAFCAGYLVASLVAEVRIRIEEKKWTP